MEKRILCYLLTCICSFSDNEQSVLSNFIWIKSNYLAIDFAYYQHIYLELLKTVYSKINLGLHETSYKYVLTSYLSIIHDKSHGLATAYFYGVRGLWLMRK